MSVTKRITVLALSTAFAAIPILGVQASGASAALAPPQLIQPCHPKWIVGPFDAQYDQETAAVGGNTEHPEGTVSWTDLTYRGC